MLLELIWAYFFFAGTLFLTYFILEQNRLRADIRKKLALSYSQERIQSAKNISYYLKLLLSPLKKKLLDATPLNFKKKLEVMLNLSGLHWEVGNLLFLKLVLFILLPIASFLLIHGKATSLYQLLIALLFSAAGFFLPDIILKRKVSARKQKIKHSLPPFIDYLNVSVEAGLGLDLAMSRVIDLIHGPLAEEMRNAMTDIRYGKSKRDAFKNLSARLDIPELTAFLTALINGEQFGIGLGSILKAQGQQIREKRRQSIQEKAYKIPVKLVFPLVIFILPGLFVVLLGPALIQVVGTLF